MDIKLDFDVDSWTMSEQMAFEDAAKVTCDQAQILLMKGSASKDSDDGKMLLAIDSLFAVPARVRVAFLWIAARRDDPDLTFEQAVEQFKGEDFMNALKAAGEDDAPLEEPASPDAPSTSESSEPSAPSAAAPRRKSSK